MRSMTGYGKCVLKENGKELSIELKSVNHRYLDLGFKSGKYFSFIEEKLRKIIQSYLSRGHMDIYINYKNTGEDAKVIKVDYALLKVYLDAYKEVEAIGLKNDLTLTSAMRLPDVITIEEQEENQEDLARLVEKALRLALEEMCAQRETEGKNLKEDIISRVKMIREQLGIIEQKATEVVGIYRDKLLKRLEDLVNINDLDENRLNMEISIFADKSNIDEEIVRLNSHLDQLLTTMDMDEAIGRKLDFIVQEINRETNTIASKAVNTNITSAALFIKNEVEKIREQVQNIE